MTTLGAREATKQRAAPRLATFIEWTARKEMRKWFSEKENIILISIVAGAWVVAFVLYFSAGADPLDLDKQAHDVVEQTNRLSNEPGDKNMRLTHLILSELIRTHKAS